MTFITEEEYHEYLYRYISPAVHLQFLLWLQSKAEEPT